MNRAKRTDVQSSVYEHTERLQIMVEDARRLGVEFILDHPVAQCAVRYAGWIQNFLVETDVDLTGGGNNKITPHEAHTRHKAPSNVVGFLERVLLCSKLNDNQQPRFFVGWALGHKDADIITLMEGGSVRYNDSLKYSPEGRSVANNHELLNALGKMKATKTTTQGCFTCEHGINVNVGRKHTFECRQTMRS